MRDFACRIRDHMTEADALKQGLDSQGPQLIRQLQDEDGPASVSIRKIAKRSGLSPTYVSLVSNRQRTISFGAFLKLTDLWMNGKCN